MSIGSYTPGSTYSAPQTGYSTGYADPGLSATTPTAGYGTPTDSYNPTSGVTTSGPYGANVPVQGASSGLSLFGGILGAAGGGFAAFKFIVPMLARSRSLPGLAVAGIVGIGALIGGFFGKKLTGG